MKRKICIECQLPIQGRTDKRFCDDFCRNSYNNRLNSYQNNITRNINTILRKNRRIIERQFDTNKIIKIKRNELLMEGYNFTYHTHTMHSKEGQSYIFVYNYGYLELENDYILLVSQDAKEK
ncbi:hypothetical protein [Sphingobacterium rhinopitheci]|uniref:hypothetical protein n=1 Tax=Sphingobacterium rhinopitheci TaxID=2781960 RepID=UPI001F51A619|nr:hypothetical protein [Sphingobacterium rhinopitheci]MCI0922286.1 hypothetical protein [Sphingobacterium rhinopitheci]